MESSVPQDMKKLHACANPVHYNFLEIDDKQWPTMGEEYMQIEIKYHQYK